MIVLRRSHSSVRSVPRTIKINGAQTKVLSSPTEYLQSILTLIASARTDIVLSALYFGTGAPEQRIITEIERALSDENRPNLKCTFILDHSRAQRTPSSLMEKSSLDFLSPLMKMYGKRMKVLLYRMPQHFGFFNSFIPGQLSEILGVYHCKFCIFDKTVILTGANLSAEYLTNRQDRYILVGHSVSSEEPSKMEHSSRDCSQSNLLSFLLSFVQIIDPYCCRVELNVATSEIQVDKKSSKSISVGRSADSVENKTAARLIINEPMIQDSLSQNILGESIMELLSDSRRGTSVPSSSHSGSLSTAQSRSDFHSDSTFDSCTTVTSLRPLVQHYSCGVLNESEQLFNLFFPSVVDKSVMNPLSVSNKLFDMDTPITGLNPPVNSILKNDSISPTLPSANDISLITDISVIRSDVFTQADVNENARNNFNIKNIHRNKSSPSNDYNMDSRHTYGNNYNWNKIVIASPYPSFLSKFTSSLLSVSNLSVSTVPVSCYSTCEKMSKNNIKSETKPSLEFTEGFEIESKIEINAYSHIPPRVLSENIQTKRPEIQKIELNRKMINAHDVNIGNDVNNDLHDNTNNDINNYMKSVLNNDMNNNKIDNIDNGSINKSININDNNTNIDGIHNYYNQIKKDIVNNSKCIDMKIIISSDQSHGFSNGGGFKKLIPKMHSHALQNVLLQSLRCLDKRQKIEKFIDINEKSKIMIDSGTNIIDTFKDDSFGKKEICSDMQTKETSFFSHEDATKKRDLYDNITVCPYYRKDWTFHAKGIWLFANFSDHDNNLFSAVGSSDDINLTSAVTAPAPPLTSTSTSKNVPITRCIKNDIKIHPPVKNVLSSNIPLVATYIGSSNFGERSYGRDFELGFVLHSNCPLLANKLSEECARLEEHSSEMTMSVKEYASKAEGKGTEWYIPILTKMLRTFL